ncbi:MAG: hypothetical protein HOB79_19330 [Rhodospirillaceae bacterium]|mgnify:CR=1 FL=1|jgi:hypothetical protein|nr:hypothetical protein [Rhodospirillaceae bacterium]
MTTKSKLDRLRKDEFYLSGLPDTICIPALGDRQEEVTKPIETATLDDLAFAQLGLQAKSSALHSKTNALQRIYEMARQNGHLGSDNALDSIPDKKGDK